MSRRYSKILQAAKDLPFLENYIKWMTSAETRQPNVGKGKARKASQKLLITPFTVTLPETERVASSGAFPTWEQYSAEVGAHAVALTAANAATAIKLAHFVPARVHIITGRRPPGEPGTVKVSHVTGRKYVSRGGTSTSLPFGKAAPADTEASAFTAIAASIKTAATAGVEITLSPEKSSPVTA